MKKQLVMTREKIYRSSEFRIDPNDPDHVLEDEEVVGSDEDCGYWNEYYRVGVVLDGDYFGAGSFVENAEDFYSYEQALKRYNELKGDYEKI